MRHLYVERGRHIVTLALSLQSLELVHILKELTVERRLITQDPVQCRFHKWVHSPQLFRFIPGCDTEPPIFLRDLFDQNLFQRTHGFQILSQVVQQTSEVSPVPADETRKSLGEQPVPLTVPGTDRLPQAVFGPVDFFAFLRLASILRCEDPFEGIVNVCVDTPSLASVFNDSAGRDSDKDCSDSAGDEPLFP